MAEKVLDYDRGIVPQETGWWCGPAAVQIVLDSRNIKLPEREIAMAVEQLENPGRGDDRDGTDYVGLLERYLDGRVPAAEYASEYITNARPTTEQVDRLWARVRAGIDAGWGSVLNWVAPPSNKPRGVNGSVSPSYSGGTTYHYVAAMGYKDDVPGVGRALWIADSGFRPFGYWVSLDQAVQLITPKGYTYPTAVSTAPTQPVPPVVYTRAGNIKTVIAVGQRLGVKPRGIQIGLATTEVESNTRVLANPKVPESLVLPNQGVGTDGLSVGMWQQQVVMGNGWWWGDARTCMDPVSSSQLFFNRLLALDYMNPNRSPGSFAQAVQKSAYPTRYDERFAAAVALYNEYVGQVADTDGEVTMSLLQPSRSIYRTSNEPTMTGDDASRGADACSHMHWVESAAERCEAWALDLVRATASGTGAGATAWWEAIKDKNTKIIDPWAVAHATAVFDNILATRPDQVRAYLVSKGLLK